MPSANLTHTGKLGPGNSVTSLPLNDVKSFKVDLEKSIIKIVYINNGLRKTQYLDYAGVTTVTYVISGGVGTLTIS